MPACGVRLLSRFRMSNREKVAIARRRQMLLFSTSRIEVEGGL